MPKQLDATSIPAEPATDVDVAVILESWDMSNDSYPALLEKQRRLEADREMIKNELKTKRGMWRKIRDTLVPA